MSSNNMSIGMSGYLKKEDFLEAKLLAQAAEIASLKARVAKLEAALESIGRQNTTAEITRDEDCGPEGDFEYAYDMLIKIARAALGERPE